MDDFDDDDRPYVESRFRDRGPTPPRGYRPSPWHDLTLADPPAPRRADRWRQAWQASRLYHGLQRLGDAWVGTRDAWQRRGNRRPTYAAQEEWWAYYRGLYQGHDPDPARFDRLLRRRGVPDWANPFPIDDLAHYDFHPDGLMLADAEAVLKSFRLRWAGGSGQPEVDETITRQGQLAAVCMGLAIARARQLPILKAEIAPANLALLVTEAALVEGRPYGVSSTAVLQGATRTGLVSSEDMALLKPLVLSVQADSGA